MPEIQKHWLSDIDQVNTPEYYQILQDTTTIFNDAGNGIKLMLPHYPTGDFSIYYKTSGGGTIDFEFFLSPDGTVQANPSSSRTIIAGVATGTIAFTGFNAVLSPWMGIRAIEQDVGPVNFEKLVLFFH